MGIRVAVASSDGKEVDGHFGRARAFRVYELGPASWEFKEVRENVPACLGQEHNEDALERTADLIADCSGVVVEQIGSGAVELLLAKRIMPFMLFGTVQQALITLQDSRRFSFLRRAQQYSNQSQRIN